MKSELLLAIFLIIWFGIGGYLIYLDVQLRKLKQKVEFQTKSEQNE